MPKIGKHVNALGQVRVVVELIDDLIIYEYVAANGKKKTSSCHDDAWRRWIEGRRPGCRTEKGSGHARID